VSITRIFDIIEYQQSVCPLDNCLSRRENKKSWTNYSTAEFIDTAHQLSQGLVQLGLQKGDTIAIISTTNRPEWHFVDLACLQIGVEVELDTESVVQQAVQALLKEYKTDSDTFSKWIEEYVFDLIEEDKSWKIEKIFLY